jgi:hypothetical protein
MILDGVSFPAFWSAQTKAFVLSSSLLLVVAGAVICAALSQGVASIAATVTAYVLTIALGGSLRLGGELFARSEGILDLESETRALRKLSRIADQQKNRRSSAYFHRMELKAHRMRGAADPFERMFSWLYDVMSGYGESIWRPIAATAVSALVFAALYWAWSAANFSPQVVLASFPSAENTTVSPEFLSALEFSAQNMVRPFSVWSSGSAGCNFDQTLLASAEGCRPSWAADLSDGSVVLHRLLVRVVASIQTIFSLTMLFLFGLALRRKFQV